MPQCQSIPIGERGPHHDERNFTTRYAYDKRGNLSATSYPDGGSRAYTYDAAYSLVRTAADSYGNQTVYEYFGKGDLRSTTDRLKNKSLFTFGLEPGLVQTITDARNNTSGFVYDANRRIQFAIDPDENGAVNLDVVEGSNPYTVTAYDAAGNQQFFRDQVGRVTATAYDALNRLTGRTDEMAGGLEAWQYNAQGQIVFSADRKGVATVSAYDSRGLTMFVTEASGMSLARTTKFVYDKAGNETVEWRPRAYDNGSGVEAGEPFWDRVASGFDKRNRPDWVIEGTSYYEPLSGNADDGALARTTKMGYDAAGNRVWVQYKQQYDSQAGAGGSVTIRDVFGYDRMNRGNFVELGAVWDVVTGKAAVAGRQTVSLYDRNGNTWLSIAPDLTLTVYGHDKLDRLERVTEAYGTRYARTTRTGYDKVGNVEWTTDGNGFKTVNGYDSLNRVVSVTEALGTLVSRTTLSEYDHIGRLTRKWVPREYGAAKILIAGGPITHIATTYEYADAARTVTVTEAANLGPSQFGALAPLGHASPVTVTQYDAVGNLVLVTDPLQRMTKYGYDALGRQTSVSLNWQSVAGTEFFDRRTGWVYDAADNLRMETRGGWGTGDGGWQSVADTLRYDVHNHRTVTRLAAASTGTLAPDAASVTLTAYDAQLTVTDKVYPSWFVPDGKGGFVLDAAGNKVVEGPIKGKGPGQDVVRESTTQYTYDPLGRATKVRDPLQNVTTYRYDPLGRVELISDRDNRQRYFDHDELGHTTREYWLTGGKQQVDNVIVSYYDTLDNVVYSFEGKAAAYQFVDDSNQRGWRPVVTADTVWTVQNSGLASVSRTFDPLGRLATETTFTGTLSYSYTADDRVRIVADDKGGKTVTDYDLAGRALAFDLFEPSGKGSLFSFGYDTPTPGIGKADRVKTISGRNGTSTYDTVAIRAGMAYDKYGRETTRQWRSPAKTYYAERLETLYYPTGLVNREFRSGGGGKEFGGGNLFIEYTYDSLGLGQVVGTNTRINNDPQANYRHIPLDSAGNQPYLNRQIAQGSGYRPAVVSGYGITYDAEGNVTKVVYSPTSGGEKWWSYTYTYDQRNRITSTTYREAPAHGVWKLGDSVEFSYDSNDRVVEARDVRHPSGTLESREVFATQRYVYDGTQLYADVNAAGAYVLRYLYGPSGEPLARVDSGGPLFYLTDRQGTPLRIVNAAGDTARRDRYEGFVPTWAVGPQSDGLGVGGQPFDSAANLQWFNGRWMMPELGRYLSEGGPGVGLNPYPVANNSLPNQVAEKSQFWKGDGFWDWAGRRYLANEWVASGVDTMHWMPRRPLATVGGAVNGVLLGAPEWALDQFDVGPKTWSPEARAAWSGGDVVGTAASLFLAYGWLGVPARAGKVGQLVRWADNAQQGYKAYATGRAVHDFSEWNLRHPSGPLGVVPGEVWKWGRVAGAGLKAYGLGLTLAGPSGLVAGTLSKVGVPVRAQLRLGVGLLAWEVGGVVGDARTAAYHGRPWSASDWAYGFAPLVGGLAGGLGSRSARRAFNDAYATGARNPINWTPGASSGDVVLFSTAGPVPARNNRYSRHMNDKVCRTEF